VTEDEKNEAAFRSLLDGKAMLVHPPGFDLSKLGNLVGHVAGCDIRESQFVPPDRFYIVVKTWDDATNRPALSVGALTDLIYKPSEHRPQEEGK